VDADVIADTDAGNPVGPLFKLDAGIGGVKGSPHPQDQHQCSQGDNQRPLAVNVVVLLGKEEADDGSQEREEYDEREHSFLTPYAPLTSPDGARRWTALTHVPRERCAVYPPKAKTRR